MKNLSLHVQRIVGSAALVLLGAMLVEAQTNFGIQIQARSSPALPTGQVKMTLETSGAVTGSTLAVTSNGQTATVTVPGGQSLGGGANADTVLAVPQADNPNNLVILFVPTSQFASASNFCNLAGGHTGAQSVSFTFTGPTVSAYRINSYVAASTLDCSQAYVRIGSSPAIWSPAPPAPAADHGRNPLDLVLILDNSGSMGSAPPGVNPVPPPPYNTRYGVLSDVASQFINLWAQADGVSTINNVRVNGDPSDRLGLVFYSTTAEPIDFSAQPGGKGIFISRGSSINTNQWQPIVTSVQNHHPTNSTAIGLGLISAFNNATSGAAKSTNDVGLVLMTDGLQNVDPCFVPNSVPFCSTQTSPDPPPFIDLNFGSGPVKVLSKHISVQTVAFGIPGAVEGKLLDDIAAQTAGYHRLTRTLAETSNAFTDSLMMALKGNSLSINSRFEGTVASNATASSPSTFILDGSVERASFVLGWQGAANALDL